MLDLHPWGNCDEAALVKDYISTAPGSKKKKRKRKQCPIDASVLFNNGGPEITGVDNMKTIAEYEQRKALEKAAARVKKVKKAARRRKKRESDADDVVNMVFQEILASQTPPIQFYDRSHSPVTRTIKPPASACKAFMQVPSTHTNTQLVPSHISSTHVCTLTYT